MAVGPAKVTLKSNAQSQIYAFFAVIGKRPVEEVPKSVNQRKMKEVTQEFHYIRTIYIQAFILNSTYCRICNIKYYI